MEERDALAVALYHARQRRSEAVRRAAGAAAARGARDPALAALAALAPALGGRPRDAARALQALLATAGDGDRDRLRDAAPALRLGLALAHAQAQALSRGQLSAEAGAGAGAGAGVAKEVEALCAEEGPAPGEGALRAAAALLLAAGRPAAAFRCAHRLWEAHPRCADALCLKGWALLAAPHADLKEVRRLFDAAMEASPTRRPLGALLGAARCCERLSEHQRALALLDQAIVRLPTCAPPLLEKARHQLALLQWAQAAETAGRVLALDPRSQDALALRALIAMCRYGNYADAVSFIQRLLAELDEHEPSNAALFLQSAQLFSRLCGRNRSVLAYTFRLTEKAVDVCSNCTEIMVELGYQYFLQGRISEAIQTYRLASRLDESSVEALAGVTLCQLACGGCDQAAQQVHFLRTLQADDVSAQVLLMSAQLAAGDAARALAELDEATDAHFRRVGALPYGVDYLRRLDPDFLMQLVWEYLSYAPTISVTGWSRAGAGAGAGGSRSCSRSRSEGSSSTASGGGGGGGRQSEAVDAALNKCLTILKVICHMCPGLLESVYYLARVQFLLRDLKAAAATLQRVLEELDSAHADSNLLLALIRLHQGQAAQAAHALEAALSRNFEVRERPLYHLLVALVKKQQAGELGARVAALKAAVAKMSAAPAPGPGGFAFRWGAGCSALALADKAAVFVELADALLEAGDRAEAHAVMARASNLFAGTGHEGQLAVAQADFALRRDDVDEALALLRKVTPDDDCYEQACFKMADIHLKHRKDPEAFKQCFRDLSENAPESTSYASLGDAYMFIQEPLRAIEVYQLALKRNQVDSEITRKLGKALVRIHEYGKAVGHYLEAIRFDDNAELKYDLAELYMKLGQYQSAETILSQELDSRYDSNDTTVLKSRTKMLLLLADVQTKVCNVSSSVVTLQDAYMNQERLLKCASPDLDDDCEKQIAAKICKRIAEQACRQKNYTVSVINYKTALSHCENDTESLEALARLYLEVKECAPCERACAALLAADEGHAGARATLAELAVRAHDLPAAAAHLQRLLRDRPTHWRALARLLEVYRRAGTLELGKGLLDAAEAAGVAAAAGGRGGGGGVGAGAEGNAGVPPGELFCRALFTWFSGSPRQACHMFGNLRHDEEWGLPAVYHMLDICIDQDDLLACDVPKSETPDPDDDHDVSLKVASRLLAELRSKVPKGSSVGLRNRILENLLLLASKRKASIQRATDDFVLLMKEKENKDNVTIALGMAIALVLGKNVSRAKHILKRFVKFDWNVDDSADLERSWLLLAILYVQKGKHGTANKLLKRILGHNKGYCKAYQYAGVIAEKEQYYSEAAKQYQNAWKFGGYSNPQIAYRMAYNYMKDRKYVQALDTCQTIKKLHPGFADTCLDIVEICRNNLRT